VRIGRRAIGAAASVLVLAGCGEHAPRPVTAAEWKAVLSDWILDRRVDGHYSCAAVGAAIAHLPFLDDNRIERDLRAYEKKACNRPPAPLAPQP
jgi:hypothetical protein